MGFSNEASSGGDGKFANFKDGMIITKLDGEKKTFSHLEGALVDIYFEDAEFPKGTFYQKMVLAIAHEDGLTLLGMPFASGYGRSFCKLLPNIDPAKDIKIGGGVQKIEGTDKKYGNVFISQDGHHLKHYFTSSNEAGKNVPKPKEQKIGAGKRAKVVKDYSKVDEFFENVVSHCLTKIKKVYPEGMEAFTKKTKHVDAEDITEPIDDMPF